MKNMDRWIGWLIEQSLDDLSIFDEYKTLFMKSEEENWKEHVVEIPEEKVEEVVRFLEARLIEGWYAHMIKGKQIRVLFKGRSFLAKKGDNFKEIEDYGVAHGVPAEQMGVAGLFDLAKEEGF